MDDLLKKFVEATDIYIKERQSVQKRFQNPDDLDAITRLLRAHRQHIELAALRGLAAHIGAL